MKQIQYILFTFSILMLFNTMTFAQEERTDANIAGHVLAEDKHIPFATIVIENTTIGTTTDETGHYLLVNLPEGSFTIRAQAIGYKAQTREIVLTKSETKEINFDLEEDVLALEEVVVTGNRSKQKRYDAPVVVNTISPKTLSTVQAMTLSDGLNYCTGLRMENNCQNCGFNQVRMNGLDGPYSQILINSRPVFSGLAGVYGLELIPANIIERIEVVRGGGSALYGGNAIAGTINLILKDPIHNTYNFGLTSGLSGVGLDGSGKPAADHSLRMNTSLVSSDAKTGLTVYGFYRLREAFDANDDSFSELVKMDNTTIGTRFFHRVGYRGKLTADFFHINEERRGGDRFDYPLHETNTAEAVMHHLTNGSLAYEHFFRESDLLSLYVAAQHVDREAYYGAEKSLKDYGHTTDLTSNTGLQYKMIQGRSTLIAGVDYNTGRLLDKKLAYLDVEQAVINNDTTGENSHIDNCIVADQRTYTIGTFAQYDFVWQKLTVGLGARFDNYNITAKDEPDHNKSGQVFSPRANLMYKLWPSLKARASYSQGYRAPQIYDEDLHIETSGARQVIHRNDPDLKAETSHSLMLSLDFNKLIGKTYISLLAEGFYTHLANPFSNVFNEADENGQVVYMRMNAEEGATVQGINLEMRILPFNDLKATAGFTLQNSFYDEAQEFGENRFFRTPNQYGFLTLDWDFLPKWGFNLSGNYTGRMLVPYFGTTLADPNAGELRESDPFFDLNAKLSYTVRINGASLQLFVGLKNMFNAYQDDFDRGINRDPGYIYGPTLPRTIQAGLSIGNVFD